jgi:hypothetical protein
LSSNTSRTLVCEELNAECFKPSPLGPAVRQACPWTCCSCDDSCIGVTTTAAAGVSGAISNSDDNSLQAKHWAMIVLIAVALILVVALVLIVLRNKKKGNDDIVITPTEAMYKSPEARRGSQKYAVDDEDDIEMITMRTSTQPEPTQAWSLSPRGETSFNSASHDGDAPSGAVVLSNGGVARGSFDSSATTPRGSSAAADFGSLRRAQAAASTDVRVDSVAAGFARFCADIDTLAELTDNELDDALLRFYTTTQLMTSTRLEDLHDTVDVSPLHLAERGVDEDKFWDDAFDALPDPDDLVSVLDFLRCVCVRPAGRTFCLRVPLRCLLSYACSTLQLPPPPPPHTHTTLTHTHTTLTPHTHTHQRL